MRAGAVAVRERGDDEVALRDAAHLCPDLLHHADELVADRAQRVGGLPAVVPKVGATDAPQHDPDDGVGPAADRDAAGSVIDSRTHGYTSSLATAGATRYSWSLTCGPHVAPTLRATKVDPKASQATGKATPSRAFRGNR